VKPISRTVRDPIYRASFLLIRGGEVNDALEEFYRRVREPGDPHPWPELVWGHFSGLAGGKAGVLWFRYDADLAAVAHECFHATMYLFAEHDLKAVTDATEELFAYYLEWLVGQALRLWDAKGARAKRG
jgi:hypothetical protein